MSTFHFKYFSIDQTHAELKVGTDSMLLGSFISCENAQKGLDIGAGTGVLSCMVAQKNPSIFIDAIEINSNSYIDLKSNILNSIFRDRVNCFNDDFFTTNLLTTYDLIFSNPPFYEEKIIDKEGQNHDAKHLVNFSKTIFFQRLNTILTEQGAIWIIVPFLTYKLWINDAEKSNLFVSRIIHIDGKPGVTNRSIIVFSKLKNNLLNEEKFVVRNQLGLYTDEYHSLTADFHNKKPIK